MPVHSIFGEPEAAGGCFADRTPAAVTICSLLQALSDEGAPVIFDHMAFRTLQVW